MDREIAARIAALKNALQHGGAAQIGTVIGKLMSELPELKGHPDEAKKLAVKACEEVNTLSPDEQKAELERLAPGASKKKKKVERISVLPELPDVPEGGVVMRLAPGPSGPLHLGHTRMAILNDEYVKRYGGKLIVRMEDTNPTSVLEEAYDLIIIDLDWLGVKHDEVVLQSDRFDIYYEYARKLLEMRLAYICDCDVEVWRSLKLKEAACPHRNAPPEVNLEKWDRMLDGTTREGEASFVVKTDLSHPNPAVRDFVAFRIIDSPHPRTGSKYRLYPTYNFAVAVDDHLMGMTHVLRGKDHQNNTLRQIFVYDYLGWKKPVFIHYGWVSIEDTVLKKTTIKEKVQAGEFSGWDDVRLGTIQAMAKRGIPPGAIRAYWIDVGIKDVDIRFSWQNLYGYSQKILEPTAKRFFFVWNPAELTIEGAPDGLKGRAPIHPGHPEMGDRILHPDVSEGKPKVFIVSEDLAELKPGQVLRLKDLGNVVVGEGNMAKHIGNDLSVLKEGAKIVHWLGAERAPFKIQMEDGSWREGFVEPAALAELGTVVQFERFGYVRIGKETEGYYAHK
ncbi:MAG: glutamate--tRNA ligase [Methanobacteriota archaeon]